MKTNRFMVYAFSALMAGGMAACSNDDDSAPQPVSEGNTLLYDENGNLDPDGKMIGNGEQEFEFTGKQTLKKGTYRMQGWIYVTDGAELTLEPGTVIKGDKETSAALIVEPGGRLIAKGTAGEPIVFTSAQPKGQRKPGDWGGLILCGKAPNNNGVMNQQIEGGPRTKHGGTDSEDNSGILSYVRVEFAGYPFQKDKEINGITFGSVGRGTQVDHLQVSYSNDDSYEWFGGTVNCRNLVAFNGWDDEFDTDNGFSGNVQFCLSIRDPRIADTSQSNGFESDNDANGSTASPFTTAVFSNVTFIGPNGCDGFLNDPSYITGGSFNPENGSSLGKYQAAMQIRRSSRLSCFNSVAVGYPVGLIIDGEKGGTVEYAKAGNLKLQHILFAGMTVTGSDANKEYGDFLITYQGGSKVEDRTKESYSSTYFKAQEGNRVFAQADDLKFTTGRYTGASYKPMADSPVFGAASFTDALLAGFEPVNYVGAFGADDNWLDGWTNFDPNNTDY